MWGELSAFRLGSIHTRSVIVASSTIKERAASELNRKKTVILVAVAKGYVEEKGQEHAACVFASTYGMLCQRGVLK